MLSSLEVPVNESACNEILLTVNQNADLPEMSKTDLAESSPEDVKPISPPKKMRNGRVAQERKRRKDIADLIRQLENFLPDKGRRCKQRGVLLDMRDVLRGVLEMLQNMQKK